MASLVGHRLCESPEFDSRLGYLLFLPTVRRLGDVLAIDQNVWERDGRWRVGQAKCGKLCCCGSARQGRVSKMDLYVQFEQLPKY